MERWEIAVDSSADIRMGQYPVVNGVDIVSVPLEITVGNRTFTDDENLNTSELIEAMHQEQKASMTSCPAPGKFLSAFGGHDKILCFCMTGALSGTYNASLLAADLYRQENPQAQIHCLDSRSTGGQLVLLVQKAVQLIQSGKNFEEVCTEIDAYSQQIFLTALLGGYDNLVKAGRMNAIIGRLAEHLNIRALIANSAQGTIDVRRKVRGMNQAYREMVEEIRRRKDIQGKPVVISHCGNEAGARRVRDLIREQLNAGEISIMKCGGLTSFYVMEGGIIIGY